MNNETVSHFFTDFVFHTQATKTGGSNGGTMRYAPESTDGANAGLHLARDFLEPVKKQFPWISYGDLWTLVCASVRDAACIEGSISLSSFMREPEGATTPVIHPVLHKIQSAVVAIEEMGGPAIGWRAGRVDKEEAHCPPNGRLPDADKVN